MQYKVVSVDPFDDTTAQQIAPQGAAGVRMFRIQRVFPATAYGPSPELTKAFAGTSEELKKAFAEAIRNRA